MKLSDMKIGTKLLGGFVLVVIVFAGISGYMVLNFFRLADLQDAGAQRADDAIQISQISREVAEVYPVFADAIINRNFQETRADLQRILEQRNEHVQTVRDLVDTEEERALADEFEQQYNEFVATFEEQLFPLLEQSDTVSKRTRDALLLSRTVVQVERVYTIMADAVINRNLTQAAADLEELRTEINSNVDEIEAIVDTEEERTRKQEAIDKARKEVEQLRQQYFGPNGQLYSRQQELMRPIQKRVLEATESVATEGGYDYIVDKKGETLFLYAKEEHDLSDRVLRELGINVETDENQQNQQ